MKKRKYLNILPPYVPMAFWKRRRTVELVVYQLKEEHNGRSGAFSDGYSAAMAGLPDYCNRTLFVSAKAANLWAELVHWRSLSEAQQTAASMEANAQLAQMSEWVERVNLMHHFK